MTALADPLDPKIQLKTKLLDHLHNPNKLRAIVTGLMLTIGYVGVYMPISSGLETTSRKMAKDQKRLELGCEVEQLRTQYNRFKNRVPQKLGANEWVLYLLDGVRKFEAAKLTKWDEDEQRSIGPYKVIVVKMEFEGTFAGMDAVLDWLETNERLIRVDSVKLKPQRAEGGKLGMQLVVLGVMD